VSSAAYVKVRSGDVFKWNGAGGAEDQRQPCAIPAPFLHVSGYRGAAVGKACPDLIIWRTDSEIFRSSKWSVRTSGKLAFHPRRPCDRGAPAHWMADQTGARLPQNFRAGRMGGLRVRFHDREEIGPKMLSRIA